MLFGWTSAQWTEFLVRIGAIAVALLIVRWLGDLILRGLVGRLVGRTHTQLDDRLMDIISLPLRLLLMVMVLDIGTDQLTVLPATWDGPIEDGFFIAYATVTTLFLWRLISGLAEWYGRKAGDLTETELDEQLLPFFRRVALIGVLALMLIVVLGHFGVEVSGLVATLGVGTLVIGLAGQAALTDTISGFLLMVDRPFRIGDRIEILELNTWGDVLDVGLRSCRIRTIDNRLVVVPNSIIGQSLVVNHSFPDSHYRIQVKVSVAYGSDIEQARELIVEAATGVEGVWGGREVEALFLEMGDSGLIFGVRVWIESFEDTRRIQDKVNSAVYKALNEAGIEIPFPQRTLHHRLGDVEPEQVGRLAKAAGRVNSSG